MLWTNTKRVVKAGFINFWRNGFVSLSSIHSMTVTLFVLGSIIFFSVMLNQTLLLIKDKVDVNATFVITAKEPDILAIKSSLEALPEVSKVEYKNREQVAADFNKRHENDEAVLQALDEVGDNPFGAELSIKAKEPSQYASIVTFLNSKTLSPDNGLPIVDKINYNQNKVAIDTLTSIIETSQRVGFGLILILVSVSIMITFSTIRLSIYIAREEISVMRLVGASNKYVRGPFVIMGIMYGVISGIITTALFFPVTYYLGKATAITGTNIYMYYINNFGQILLILVGAGVILGAVSSFMAVRRYLRM